MEKGFNETGLKRGIPDECGGSFGEMDGAEVSDDDGSSGALLRLARERWTNFDTIRLGTKLVVCEGGNMEEVAGSCRRINYDVAGREVPEIALIQKFADPGRGKPLVKGNLMQRGWFSLVVMHSYFIHGGVSVEPGTIARITGTPSART